MKKKRIIVVSVLITLVVVVLVCKRKPKELVCTRSESLIEGIVAKEELKVRIKRKEIKEIKLKKEIKLGELYQDSVAYYESIEDILAKTYDYLGDEVKIKREDKKIVVEIDTLKNGIVLNNLSIKYNAEDKTTLRYDGVTDLSDETSIKVKEEKSKKEIKSKLKNIGYACK